MGHCNLHEAKNQKHCECGHEHEHAHQEHCGCSHDHEHAHQEHCGCSHDHEHAHQEHCGCSHDHEHAHQEHCGCGHEHEHCSAADTRIFLLDHLGCANCAAKMEQKINALPGVEEAVITFVTRQLRLRAEDPDSLLPQIREICASIEPDVQVIAQPAPQKADTERYIPSDGVQRKIYLIQNLGCANCAAKMERKINDLPGVERATITFATRQLRLWAKEPDLLLSQISEICTSIEPQVTLSPLSSGQKEEKPRRKGDTLFPIVLGGLLMAVGIFIHRISGPSSGLSISLLALLVHVSAYLVLGHRVLAQAFGNIRRGQVFDENFLMTVATICAFLIGEYTEAVGVMLFFRVGQYFEAVAVERSRGNIMAAMDLRPEVVQLISGERVVTIPAQEAVVGDVIEIRPGDRVPLDGTILEGESLLDTAPITGEPVPVSVGAGDSILSGCVNTSGLLRLRVDQPLETSMVTRILESVENAAASKPQMDRFITRFSRVYTPIVVALAVAVALIPSLITGQPLYWVRTACTFLVISCPCALVLSVPLAFFAGIGRASQEKILFKGGSSLEAISKVKAVVLDKTGTITEGNFKLQQLLPADGVSEEELLSIAAGCETHSTHPIAQSIRAAASERGITPLSCSGLIEHPGKGVEAEGILCGNRALLEEAGIALPSLPQAMGTQVFAAKDGRYLGQLIISDTLKKEAKAAITQLRQEGLFTAILTGDSEESAGQVAQAVGVQQVRAKLLPQEKLQALREIRSREGAVLFVGDGINDSPVLAGADVGAAMGSGADTAIEAADVVFLTGELTAVGRSIRIGRQSVSIAKQNVIFALLIKLAVIVMGFVGLANMWAAVFADTGVAILCILNSVRTLYQK